MDCKKGTKLKRETGHLLREESNLENLPGIHFLLHATVREHAIASQAPPL